MIKAYKHDITKLRDINYICNSANAQGPMGAGVANAIRRAGGMDIQVEAINTCMKKKYNPGDIYITGSGRIKCDAIFHLIIMEYPGNKLGTLNLNVIKKCLNNLIKFCRKNNIKKIALPALGTGVGKLPKSKVAKIFVDILQPVDDIEFHVVDIDIHFIHFVNEYINKEESNEENFNKVN